MSAEKLDLILNELLEIKQEQKGFKKELQSFKQDLNSFKDNQEAFKQDLLGFKDSQQAFKQDLLGFKDNQEAFKQDLLGFKDNQQAFKQDLLGFKDNQQAFKQEQLSMKDEISLIKSQLDENTQLTKAVLHRQEESDAKLDELSLVYAKTHEDISSTNENISELLVNQSAIHEMLGEHDVSIRTLRKRSI